MQASVRFGCIATAAFDRKLARFSVTLPDPVAPAAADTLSMIAVDELAEDSPLKASMNLVAKAAPKKTASARGTPAKKGGGGGVRDSPVTFGYVACLVPHACWLVYPTILAAMKLLLRVHVHKQPVFSTRTCLKLSPSDVTLGCRFPI